MKCKIIIALLTIGLFLSISNSSFAQTKLGVGVSLNPTALIGGDGGEMLFLPASLMNLYLPIQIGKTFRIEPEFGVYSQSEDRKSNSNEERKSTISFTRLGTGVFLTNQFANNFLIYYGPRLGILMTSRDYDYTDSEYQSDRSSSQNVIFFGGSFGGEYYLSDHFSLGLEVQLNYFSYGKPDEKPDEDAYKEYSQTVFTTNGLIFARIFF